MVKESTECLPSRARDLCHLYEMTVRMRQSTEGEDRVLADLLEALVNLYLGDSPRGDLEMVARSWRLALVPPEVGRTAAEEPEPRRFQMVN